MNLKDAFRYSKFLDEIALTAIASIRLKEHAFSGVKIHHKSKANPEAEDKEEAIDNGKFFPNDSVIEFVKDVALEKRMLVEEINKSKAGLNFDLDAYIEENKIRRNLADAMKTMLRYHVTNRAVAKDMDYKFNAEGNQTPYYYDVETIYEDAFDRESAKATQKKLMSDSDFNSSEIDAAIINTNVNHYASYDVNSSFEDLMEEFIANHNS